VIATIDSPRSQLVHALLEHDLVDELHPPPCATAPSETRSHLAHAPAGGYIPI
jgi:hypothetical protein